MKLITVKALVAFTSLALMADAAAVRRDPASTLVVKEQVPVPDTWVRRSDADDHQTVALRFALRQTDVAGLEKRLQQTSDPSHELYGRHLSADEVSSYLQPHKRTVDEVELWLREAGVEIDETLAKRSASMDTFTVNVPVWKARELLNADLGVYQHKRTGTLAVRSPKYSVPEHVADHLDYVGPLTLFTEPRTHSNDVANIKVLIEDEDEHDFRSAAAKKGKLDNGQPAVCNTSVVTSECLRTFYKTIDYVPQAANKFKLGISGFLEQFANFADFPDSSSSSVPMRPSRTTLPYRASTAVSTPRACPDPRPTWTSRPWVALCIRFPLPTIRREDRRHSCPIWPR